MINAKQLYGTYPHVQLRWYIERTNPGAGAQKKAALLAALTTKFVHNCNLLREDRDRVPDDVDVAFVWADSPEGHNFWLDVHMFNYHHEYDGMRMPKGIQRGLAIQPGGLIGAAVAVPVAPEVPVEAKPKIGWWT